MCRSPHTRVAKAAPAYLSASALALLRRCWSSACWRSNSSLSALWLATSRCSWCSCSCKAATAAAPEAPRRFFLNRLNAAAPNAKAYIVMVGKKARLTRGQAACQLMRLDLGHVSRHAGCLESSCSCVQSRRDSPDVAATVSWSVSGHLSLKGRRSAYLARAFQVRLYAYSHA